MKEVTRGDRHNEKRDGSAGAEEWGTGTVKGTLNSQVCVCAVCSHVIYCPVLYVNIYNNVSIRRRFTNRRLPFLGHSSSSSSPPLPLLQRRSRRRILHATFFFLLIFFYNFYLEFLMAVCKLCANSQLGQLCELSAK